MSDVQILVGDAREQLRTLPDQSVQTCITSPPYWGLRNYGVEGQMGQEATVTEYVERLVAVFREVKRVLRDDGTLWLVIGDSFYNDGKWGGATGGKHAKALHGEPVGRLRRRTGLKPKDLVGIPWRVAFALRDDGWYLRSDVIEEVELYCPCGCGYVLEERIWRYSQDRSILWKKPNPLPESVTDRPTRSHEYIFLLSKHARYYYDAVAIREPARDGSHTRNAPYALTVPGQSPHQGLHRDKQRCHGRRHAGFNARWDAMTRAEQGANVRNKRDVWTVATQPFAGGHSATFPDALVEPMVLAGCPVGGTVLDPFAGSGTTLAVATRLGRHAVGIELNPAYVPLIQRRLADVRVRQRDWLREEENR